MNSHRVHKSQSSPAIDMYPATDQPTAQHLTGLTVDEVEAARKQYGPNTLTLNHTQTGWQLTVDIVTEPMFILLAIASLLYVLLGQWQEGVVLGVAMLLVAGISVYQSVRSNQALQALRQLTQPTVSVLRDSELIALPAEQIVVGDIVWLTEGQTVPADGRLKQANDCSVDEAILTGESVPVTKTTPDTDRFLAGTLLTSGSAYVQISDVGEATTLGRLGKSLQTIEVEKTPLQIQIGRFVQRMAFAGFGAFALVWGINFAHTGDWAMSLLLGLTIAMSVLPEEIPVAFSSFMALGAARMVQFGVLTKQPQTVESLGSATVICTDKTGTITQDGMTVARLYDGITHTLVPLTAPLSAPALDLLAYARWASEPEPFDPMEQAIVSAYGQQAAPVVHPLQYEYPLDGTPPMMTHVYAPDTGPVRVAGKGAAERIAQVCHLSAEAASLIEQQAIELAGQGYRVLGVAGSDWPDTDFPARQDDFPWIFKGLIALENPPKINAETVIRQFTQAGIVVKMITGDSPETANAIARQVALPSDGQTLTGQNVMALSELDLQTQVKQVSVFARMFPEAKLRVIRALKANGEVVAMTGDGVNDGPALRAAHIGVAMGRRGTEVAKEAASLVLVDDDLAGMVDAIAQGRRIYQNLKRAIGYIVSIHIPIILTVTVPLLFGWRYVNLFSPVHIIFLELVMGPTCSIAFENEPAEHDLMRQRPRRLTDTFFTAGELGISVVQGLVIALAVLLVYGRAMQTGTPLDQVRTMAFVTLVLSNIWLTLVSRSSQQSVLATLRRPNSLLWLMLAITLLMLGGSLLLPSIRGLAQFTTLTSSQLGHCLLWSGLGVGWIEVYKRWRYRKTA
ncbi:cation-translocating P-type ATPase [Spirosoma utsteinense]|uniref:Ca2+-transporting ATPase n=1 Tax=Spirosoma utsteinense TaxID=2585773 RepID=A0ABR6WEG9_9BACT|nr:cation-translocating P-type ATPase [Spirosoma utsteinense]MBC3787982.1 Ca2+-transporting ATPase [Spirosoma utsteinense]MBC3794941.1 Ca2+-transporting ATPase [Spirosoma utsteinense]